MWRDRKFFAKRDDVDDDAKDETTLSSLTLVTRANGIVGNYFPWFILAAIAAGLRWGYGEGLESFAGWIVATNMFVMALKCSPQSFRDALKSPLRVIVATLLLFGVMPAVSFVLARTLLPASSGFGPGVIMVAVLPAAVTSSVWTGIAKGNIPLNLTIIGTTTLLSGIVTPALLSLLVGVFVTVDTAALFRGLLVTVMIPVLLGVLLHHPFERVRPQLGTALELLVKLGICMILFINGSVLAPYLVEWGWRIAGFASVVILQTSVAYGLAYAITKWGMRLPLADVISMTFSVGMRNNGAGIVLALAHFGPIVAMPVIISILAQQPIASLMYRYVIRPGAEGRAESVST